MSRPSLAIVTVAAYVGLEGSNNNKDVIVIALQTRSSKALANASRPKQGSSLAKPIGILKRKEATLSPIVVKARQGTIRSLLEEAEAEATKERANSQTQTQS